MTAPATTPARVVRDNCDECAKPRSRLMKRAYQVVFFGLLAGGLFTLSGNVLAVVLGVMLSVSVLGVARTVYTSLEATEYDLQARGVLRSETIAWEDCDAVLVVVPEGCSWLASGPASAVQQYGMYICMIAGMGALKALGVPEASDWVGDIVGAMALGMFGGIVLEALCWTSLRVAGILRTGFSLLVVERGRRRFVPIRVALCPHSAEDIARLAEDKSVLVFRVPPEDVRKKVLWALSAFRRSGNR